MAKKYVHEIVLQVTTTNEPKHENYKYEVEKALAFTDWDGDTFEVVSTKKLSEETIAKKTDGE